MDMTQCKSVISRTPAAAITGATNTTGVDTLGANYAIVTAILGAVVGDMTVLKLQHSDDNSAWSDVSGGDLASASGDEAAALPTDTDDDIIIKWFVKLNAFKRYLRVSATPDTSAIIVVTVDLYKQAIGLNTATERGLHANRFLQ